LHLNHFIVLLGVATIGGVLNALAGGGSFITFPTLLFLGIPPVQANATNTVAMWTGLLASGGAYLNRLSVPRRLLAALVLTSIVGGFAGGLLLLKTPQHTFLHLVPWLLLAATMLFIFGNRLRRLGRRGADEDRREYSWTALVVASFFEFLVGVYGGYFGGGIGFMNLGMLSVLGMREVHAINALRTLLAVSINVAAVAAFIVAGAVWWRYCAVMIVGALLGGWFGARYAQRAHPTKIRYFIITLGLSMTLYFFITVYVKI
jgi:uncharacterized protein